MANQQKKLCYVGNYHPIEKEAIRETVCRDLSIECKVRNNDYCLLHAPTLDKDQQEFDRLFKERISRNESHFEAVVFPIPVDFNHYEFSLPLNFLRATFLSNVTLSDIRIKYIYFDWAEFHALAQFYNCLFGEVATFTGTIFNREASFTGSHFKLSRFNHATFKGHTKFNGWAKFIDETDFSSARFLGPTDFDTVTFESPVSFNEVEFGENSKVSFFQSCFQNQASIQKAIFKSYLNFESVPSRDLFGDNASLSFVKRGSKRLRNCPFIR